MSTHAIITNWKRPLNAIRIAEQLKAQTVPFDKITIVNNSQQVDNIITVTNDSADTWTFPDNGYGPTCRFAPALINWRYKYTFFIDDDLLPGLRVHEHLLEAAELLHDNFATIGEVGRVYALQQPNPVYVRRDIARSPERCTRVDLTCRAHFVHTANVRHAIEFREQLLRRFGAPARGPEDWTRHDDILLCHGIQLYTNQCSWLSHKGEKATFIRAEDLPEPDAMWHRPGHAASRQQLLNLSSQLGWTGLTTK